MILVSGATGYVGGRLVPRLLEQGHAVRCLVRDEARLVGRSWRAQVDVARGDITDAESLHAAMQGVEVAYYLVHTMQEGHGFRDRDREGARNFARAARAAGVRRLIYLGGLGQPDAQLSTHLRSRQEVGDVLRAEGPPVTEFRAGVIVGSGSLSFELVRYLTERVPVMICPRWVYTRAQPIAIRDVLSYLVAALDGPPAIIEIGGAVRLSYGDMMLGYARVRGLRRWMIPVPVLTPRLSSYWVHFVTPVPAAIAAPLIEGLRNEVIADTRLAREHFPQIQPMSYEEAVRRALARVHDGNLDSTWCDALSSSMGTRRPVTLHVQEGMIVERRVQRVAACPQAVYETFCGLGGARGWLYGDVLWRIRGALDRIVGGVGLRRGRRDPDELRMGDALDFWRVEALEAGRLLRLRAEMKVPGRAWLQFEAIPDGDGRTHLVQTAFFAPRGLGGLAYWYGLYPVHALIFRGLVARLAKAAETRAPQLLG